MSVRLEWDGKPTQVERISLPFQTVETINESRASRERDTGALFGAVGGTDNAWHNQLIWGDNKLVMSSLVKEFAGQVKLIYIDPPFATGSDFELRLNIGDETITKAATVLEEHAYRDTWGRGLESYLTMMAERLHLIRELLADDGTLYVHTDHRVSAHLKHLCDEIFGFDHFLNVVTWRRQIPRGMKAHARYMPHSADFILMYRRGGEAIWNEAKKETLISIAEAEKKYMRDDRGFFRTSDPGTYSDASLVRLHEEGRIHVTRGGEFVVDEDGKVKTTVGSIGVKYYREQREGKVVESTVIDNIWDDVPGMGIVSSEYLGYPTQKPEALLARVIEASSNEKDLIADFFVGSGTFAAVAEKLNRHWIGCDLGRFAIHTTRKRLLNIPDCRPFEIRNLGSYERQHWRQDTGNGALRGYLDTMLSFYRAEPVEGFAHLHGRKAGRMVHVGATDAPVTIDEVDEVMDELADNGIESCDILGWEWEMGLHDTMGERARRRGLDVRVLQIPREVMERRVQEADAVRFFELAHVDLDVRRQKLEAMIVLKDFAIPSEDLIPAQVRESITSWSDLIDYWSVDFDHSDGVFHNQWQAYRTRAEPSLATESDWHEYPAAGTYAVVVKIIDIFGNDTTKLAEVTIK